MKVARLSDGCLHPSGDTPGTHSCYRLSWPQGQSVAERIQSMKNPNEPTRNQTCDLPACSNVPQPTAQYWAEEEYVTNIHKKLKNVYGINAVDISSVSWGSQISFQKKPKRSWAMPPGPQCGWKDSINEKSQWTHQESNLWPSSLQQSASANCTMLGRGGICNMVSMLLI